MVSVSGTERGHDTRPGEDAARAAVLTQTAGWNYDCDHPGIRYCGGCVVKIRGEDMLADLREAGWDLVRLAR